MFFPTQIYLYISEYVIDKPVPNRENRYDFIIYQNKFHILVPFSYHQIEFNERAIMKTSDQRSYIRIQLD